jgi:hypothetical protein
MGKILPLQEQKTASDEDIEKCEKLDRRENKAPIRLI